MTNKAFHVHIMLTAFHQQVPKHFIKESGIFISNSHTGTLRRGQSTVSLSSAVSPGIETMSIRFKSNIV